MAFRRTFDKKALSRRLDGVVEEMVASRRRRRRTGGEVMSEEWRRYIHYSELTLDDPNEELGPEWNTYVREVGRLLTEGHEAKWVLIKGDQILGIYDTEPEAFREGYRHSLDESFMVHQIRTWERVYFETIRYR